MQTLPRRTLLLALLASVPPILLGCGSSANESPEPPAEPALPLDGLAGKTVRRLRVSPLGLLAATDDGLHARSVSGWRSLGLQGHEVLDVVALDSQYLLASVHPVAAPPSQATLARSLDGGASWQSLANDFGGGPVQLEAIQALAYDAAAARVLATGADVLAESRDGGRTWHKLAGDWQRLAAGKDALAFDPQRGDVWFGGQDAIERLALFRYASGRVDAYPGLMPAPSTAKAIRFIMGQPDRLLVSGEGGIVETRDNGQSWRRILDGGHRFYFDVLQDVNRPQRLVTASWIKGQSSPQPLQIEVSDDDGQTWSRQVWRTPTAFGGAWSLALALDSGRSVVYFGLYRGGVVRLALD